MFPGFKDNLLNRDYILRAVNIVEDIVYIAVVLIKLRRSLIT